MKRARPKVQPDSLLHNSILEVINDILSVALSSDSEKDFGIRCLEIAQRLTRSNFGFIGIINENGQEEIAVSSPVRVETGIVEGSGHRITFKTQGIYSRIISDGKPFLTNDLTNHTDEFGLPADHPPINNLLGVPLVRLGLTIGVLAVCNRAGGYTLKEQKTVEALVPTVVESFMHKRAEELLRQSELKFRNLVKYAPAVIYEMDINGEKFLRINDTMCSILGYSHDELLSIKPLDLLDERSKLLFKERIWKRMAGNRIEEAVEYSVRKKNGEWIYVVINVGNLSYSEELPATITVVAYDITERRRMEEALRDSEKKYRDLIKFAPTGIYEVDFRTRKFTTVNDSMCLLTGYSRDELLSMTPFEILDDEGKKAFRQRINKWLSGEKPDENVEYKVTAKDGHIICALLNVKFRADEMGNPIGATVVAHDVTERRRAEEALRESEERFRTAFESSAVPMALTATDGRLMKVNAVFCQLLGYSAEELIGHSFTEFTYPEDLPENQAKAQILFEDGQQFSMEKRYVRKDGTVVWADINAAAVLDPEGKPLYVITHVQNITARKHAEKALMKSEQLYRAIGESIDYGVWVCEPDGRNVYASESYLNLVGMTQEQCSNFGWGDSLHPDDAEKTIAAWKECVMTGGKWDIEHRFRGVDGNWHPILARGVPIRDEHGTVTSWAGINLDIANIKQAEAALRESEERFRSIMNNSRDIIYRLNLQTGFYEYISPSCYDLVGYSPEELMTTKFESPIERVHPDDIDRWLTGMQKILETGAGEMEYRQIWKSGDYRWFSNYITIIKDNNGMPLFRDGIIRDITARKRTEEALKNNEARLIELNATKDKFFNILAHDLKNPFTSLIGSSEILYNHVHHMDKETIQSLALNLNDSAKSGYAILENLLAWSRSQTGLLKQTPERINLNKLIEENLSNLQLFSSNKAINLQTEVEKNMFFTSDKAMISLILRNLISNAIKFTPRGGKVVITGMINSDEVQISVRDNGIGISGENIKTLFSLDTKHTMVGTENEQGTGLGLKLCKEFAEKLGGKIWVESIPDKGSTFFFSTPGNFQQEIQDTRDILPDISEPFMVT